jgi:glycopeptide antibiotics resistance protein
MRRRAVLPIFTVLYLVVVAWITLNPAPGDPARNPLLESVLRALAAVPVLHWIDYPVTEFTANVLLFVPMGALFTLLLGRWRWWLAWAIGVAATLVIEFVQLFLPARVSDASDLVANTLGTLLGIGLILLVTRGRRQAGESART